MIYRMLMFVGLLTLLATNVWATEITARNSDFDGDGVVEIPDYFLFVDAFGTSWGDEGWDERFDLNSDGVIGVGDFLIFIENFGKVLVKPLCDRTSEIRDAILSVLDETDCGAVTLTDLQGIDTLDVSNTGLMGILMEDLEGLDNLTVLDISGNMLQSIPDSLFYRLDSLKAVDARGNEGVLPFPFTLSRVDDLPMSAARPATLRLSIPYKALWDTKATVAIQNVGHGAHRNVVIPRDSTYVDFKFDTFDTEISGWGYSHSDSNDPPYAVLLRGRKPVITYGMDPHAGARGFFGFTAVLDTLCFYGTDCASFLGESPIVASGGRADTSENYSSGNTSNPQDHLGIKLIVTPDTLIVKYPKKKGEWSVRLGSEPDEPVTVFISDPYPWFTTKDRELTFTSKNWYKIQKVTFTVHPDVLFGNFSTGFSPIYFSCQSVDPNYNGNGDDIFHYGSVGYRQKKGD